LSEGGTQVLEKRRVPGEGLRMMLSQRVNFPKPIRAYNPRTGFMEEKTSLEVLFDASIPEEQYSVYEGFSPGRDAKDRIVLLLASLGYSYPTTAVSEAAGVAHSTTCRLLWELKRDGLIEGAFSSGSYVNGDVWPYRYGPIRENYWMLASGGAARAGELMRLRVTPLAPPREEVLKEKAEHPWLTMEQAERVAREHMEEARKRVKEIREKQARGEELTLEELRILYGTELPTIEEGKEIVRGEEQLGMAPEAPVGVVTPAERRLLEKIRAEKPWDAAGRRAEEARKKYDKLG